MATLSEKLKKLLDKELSPDEKNLLIITEFESRKDTVVMRFTPGMQAVESLFEKVKIIGSKSGITVCKSGRYATALDYDAVLSDINWLWENWIPRGLITLIVGDPGVGKTFLCVDFARIITRGLHFPIVDNKPPLYLEPSRVLWIDAENGQQILRGRLISMNVNREFVNIPIIEEDILQKPDFDNEDHKRYLRQMIEDLRPTAVIVDSFGGANPRGENKVEEVKPFLEFLGDIAQEFDLAMIILHHLSKPAGEQIEITINRARGSTAISALARSIIGFEQGTADDIKKLRLIKSNVASTKQPDYSVKFVTDPIDPSQVVGLEYGNYKAPPAKETQKEKCAKWIIEILKEANAPVALHDIVENGATLSFSRNTIYAARSILGDQITISGTGNKAFWAISEEPASDTDAMNAITGALNYAEI